MFLISEAQHAVRSLARSPLLVAVAVASLALGIGVNATIFTFVNAVEFRPLPFADADRLVDVSEANPKELCAGCSVGTSWPTLGLWRSSARSFSALEAYREQSFAVAGQQEAERVGGALVTAGLFPVLGIQPLVGRGLTSADDRPGAPGVVLLSYSLWIRRFGGDSATLGRTIRVNGIGRTVIGVMPPGFRFPEYASLWVPMAPEVTTMPVDDRGLSVVGRLAPGADAGTAGIEMGGIAGRLATERPADYANWTAVVGPLREDLTADASSQGFVLALAASGFVLLIACANLANLFLARATTRSRELAVRVALGASRARIAGHLLIESVLLAFLGGLVGFVLSLWGIRLIVGVIDTELPYWLHTGVDWRILLYTFLLSLLAGLLFGALPALRATRTEIQDTLKSSGAGATAHPRESRLRGALAVIQVALAVILLAGASVMIKSFLAERRNDRLGYNPKGVLTARMQLQAPAYENQDLVRDVEAQLLDRLRSQPMVDAVALEHPIFLNAFVGNASAVQLEGAGQPVPMGQGPGHGNAVTPDYFRLLEIPLLSGRGILPSDGPAAPGVVVLNRQTASMYWPGTSALGKRLRIAGGPWLTVVGIVADVANHPFGRGPLPMLYTAAAQESSRPFRVMVRFKGDVGTAATTLKAVVRTIDPDEPVEDLMTLEEDLARMITPVRFLAVLFGALGAIALGLAALGIYGVMAYLVARRTRELGIRMALGAESRDLHRFVLGRGLRLALTGSALGLPVALLLARALRGFLWTISPTDPVAMLSAVALLTGIAVLACWAPARRATRVDPLVSLRAE